MDFETGTINKPPKFLVNNFNMCKIRMKEFLGFYDSISVQEGRTMLQQWDRLTKLMNELRSKGREYDVDGFLHKFLRSLPAQWRMYAISTRNSFDLNKLDLVELHGMLKTYDWEMCQDSKMLNNTKKGIGASV
ncbi:hypothetical protein L1987_71314 [Smallanthus sonchifolius]|uniref:Uncharacterized protein n=1 Tax=Smallanthus sonchifolius TaxID=185202 RepID=A0ACB9ASX1_9ASTR|nr:hypothetical protein L1987_71314 [Smallanthus sonchifolius]